VICMVTRKYSPPASPSIGCGRPLLAPAITPTVISSASPVAYQSVWLCSVVPIHCDAKEHDLQLLRCLRARSLHTWRNILVAAGTAGQVGLGILCYGYRMSFWQRWFCERITLVLAPAPQACKHPSFGMHHGVVFLQLINVEWNLDSSIAR